MSSIRQTLRQQHFTCTEKLDYDVEHHERADFREEAKVLKEACEAFLLSKYDYLIAYEYHLPSHYKGDAILAKLRNDGKIDILALEAKHINYSPDVVWRNQKRKLQKLREQVTRCGNNASHYLTEILEWDTDSIGTIKPFGVYNGRNGELRDHTKDLIEPEHFEQTTRLDSEVPVTSTTTNQGNGSFWGALAVVGAVSLGAMYVATNNNNPPNQQQQQIQQQGRRNNENEESQQECLIM